MAPRTIRPMLSKPIYLSAAESIRFLSYANLASALLLKPICSTFQAAQVTGPNQTTLPPRGHCIQWGYDKFTLANGTLTSETNAGLSPQWSFALECMADLEQVPRLRKEEWVWPLLKNRNEGGRHLNHLLKLTLCGLRVDGVLFLRTNANLPQCVFVVTLRTALS